MLKNDNYQIGPGSQNGTIQDLQDRRHKIKTIVESGKDGKIFITPSMRTALANELRTINQILNRNYLSTKQEAIRVLDTDELRLLFRIGLKFKLLKK